MHGEQLFFFGLACFLGGVSVSAIFAGYVWFFWYSDGFREKPTTAQAIRQVLKQHEAEMFAEEVERFSRGRR